jgi:hypothetical protein
MGNSLVYHMDIKQIRYTNLDIVYRGQNYVKAELVVLPKKKKKQT